MFEKNDLIERLLECEKELQFHKEELQTWTESLEELSEIEDAFKTDGKFRLRGKTVLDVGTDCVKPLYLSLKFEPKKIIGINEDLSNYSFESNVKQKSKLFTKTKIGLYNCSLFNNATLDKILKEEGISKPKKFDFVLVSKTLHHLRTGECIKNERDKKHEHKTDETEKCCIYRFEKQRIFERLLKLGNRVIIYEAFYPQDEDNDNVRGRGGYFTASEWKDIFKYLSKNYKVKIITPRQFHLDNETLDKVDSILREEDCIGFYVEKQS